MSEVVNAGLYRKMFEEAEASVEYWIAGPELEFCEDLCRLMKEKKVSRAELARRIGTSRAYITKLLAGGANFTLTTMVKLAMALDGAVHVHIADKRARTRWHDELPGQPPESGEPAGDGAAKKPRKRPSRKASKTQEREA
ncbi:MAG TPA: helix-turn-helix transcriptional regulator [Thermoanaerobaculia bacterium]